MIWDNKQKTGLELQQSWFIDPDGAGLILQTYFYCV